MTTSRSCGWAGAALLLVSVTSGCGPVTEPPPTLLWQAELVATDVDNPLTGSSAMVAGTSLTQVGIGVANAPPQAALGWRVRNGACDEGGDALAPLTSFPPVAIDAEGDGAAEMVLNRRLSNGTYAAEVFADASGEGLLIACGTLTRYTLQ
jgi:hypothetical protein